MLALGVSAAFLLAGEASSQIQAFKRPSLELRPHWSPDGRYIAFTSDRTGNRNVLVYDLELRHVHQVTFLEQNQYVPRWAPDSKRLTFYTNYYGNPWVGAVDHDIYVINIDGSSMRRVTDAESEDIFADFSADGERLVFVSDREGIRQLFELDLASGTVEPLTPDWETDILQPRVHWASGNIVFEAASPVQDDGSGSNDLWLRRPDGTVLRLTETPEDEFGPVLSPDGTRVLFQVAHGDGNIAVMNIDGTERSLLADEGKNMTPDWSPDGSRVVYIREITEVLDPHDTRRNREIYVMNADGTGKERLLAW